MSVVGHSLVDMLNRASVFGDANRKAIITAVLETPGADIATLERADDNLIVAACRITGKLLALGRDAPNHGNA